MADHDRLFKELLKTFFHEFIALFLPDVAAYLEPGPPEFLDKEVFTDIARGERREADLVARVRFRHRDAFFLVHIENQSRSEADFARRMFRYFARLHEKHELPIYPIALFSYDAPARPEPDEYRLGFPDIDVLSFRFRVIQLNRLNWHDFVRQPNPVASALMAKMRIAPEDRPRVKLECLRLLASLKLDPARMHLISGFVDTYLRLNAAESQEFEDEMAQIAPSKREEVMEILTSWIEEGMQRILLLRAQRFLGQLPEPTVRAFQSLNKGELELLDVALDRMRTADELGEWLSSHHEPE